MKAASKLPAAFLFFGWGGNNTAKENAMKQTYDVNVKEFKPLTSPALIKEELPITEEVAQTIIDGRKNVRTFYGAMTSDSL